MKHLIHRIVRHPALILLAGIALALPHGQAQAGFWNCSTNGTRTVPANLNSVVISASRDKAVGQPISAWTPFFATAYNNWTCDMNSGNVGSDYNNVVVKSSLVSAGTNYTDSNGKTYPVFQTNLAGVGVVLGMSSSETYAGSSSDYRPIGTTWTRGVGTTTASAIRSDMGFGVALRFVKTGTITPGKISMGDIAEGRVAGNMGGTNPLDLVMETMIQGGSTGSIVVPGSCVTADQDVDMGTHSPSEFGAAVGSTLAPVDFSIKVNSCPAGMASVRYQLDVAPGITAYNAALGIINFDAASGATGAAIQVTSTSDVAYNLSTKPWQNVTPNYTGAAGNFTIPLRARYYRTAATIGPGTANSAIVFTMEYK